MLFSHCITTHIKKGTRMRKIAVGISFFALSALATPASADGFFELRLGAAVDGSGASSTVGAALGYDFDLGKDAFLGLEYVGTADTSFESDAGAVNLRLGTDVSETGRIYLTAGRVWQARSSTVIIPTSDFSIFGSSSSTVYDTIAGLGYQADISDSGYVSLQYQYGFEYNFGHAIVGVGIRF
jgi:hypothetical protein